MGSSEEVTVIITITVTELRQNSNAQPTRLDGSQSREACLAG